MVNQVEHVLPRIAMGDSAAVSICLDRYGNLVWSLAHRSLNDRQAAEDAVQEIFLKLWKVADRYDPDKSGEATFIAVIARRTLIDINRKRKLVASTDFEFDNVSGNEADVARRLELCDEAARAAELLDQLPRDQQRVIKLSVFDGLSHARISETTGLSLGTVKTHIRRGILKLRQALFPDVDLPGSENLGKSAAASGEVSG